MARYDITYLFYQVVMTGRPRDLATWRTVGSEHHSLPVAIKRAKSWQAAWVSLTRECIYLFDWKVIDVRSGETVWQWDQSDGV